MTHASLFSGIGGFACGNAIVPQVVADIQDDRRIRNKTTEMKEQVTSIEQSKRLIELGVPAEMASMVWDTISLASHPILREWDTSTDTKRWQVDRVGRLHITRSSYSRGKDWRVFYKRVGVSKGAIVSFGDSTLICPACDMIEWLLANNYKLNI